MARDQSDLKLRFRIGLDDQPLDWICNPQACHCGSAEVNGLFAVVLQLARQTATCDNTVKGIAVRETEFGADL